MDTRSAYARGQMASAMGAEQMVFDWVKAALLIKERQPNVASAGLRSDWERTGGDIWRDGKPVPEEDTYTYLSSNWAVPQLDMDGEIIECFTLRKNTDWNALTYWPQEALDIINAD